MPVDGIFKAFEMSLNRLLTIIERGDKPPTPPNSIQAVSDAIVAPIKRKAWDRLDVRA